MTREEALTEIKERVHVAEYVNSSYVDCVDIEALRMAIKSLGQPKQRWIPCSKTIDIPDHEVLCCDKYGEELIGWLSYNDDQWLCESDGEMMYDPIAWREKPEPYREEGEHE